LGNASWNLGTSWEQGGKTKNSLPPTLPPKANNRSHLYCMLNLPIGCMNFVFPKLFVTIFSLGEYPHYKLGLLIHLKNHLETIFPKDFLSENLHYFKGTPCVANWLPTSKKEVVSQRNALVKAGQ